jgi:hypothetical protein
MLCKYFMLKFLQSLGHEQHAYAIIGKKCTCVKNVFNTFINNIHWILVKIQMSTLNLHRTIYDSHIPITTQLPNAAIQLLCKLTNVNNLLYTCKYNATNRQLIMQCFHNSICNKHCVWI